jgi:hypothetical protein
MHYKNNFFYRVLFHYPESVSYYSLFLQPKKETIKKQQDVKMIIKYEKDDILRSEKWMNRIQNENKSLDNIWKEKEVKEIKRNNLVFDEVEIGWPIVFFFVSSVGIGIGFGIGYKFYYK